MAVVVHLGLWLLLNFGRASHRRGNSSSHYGRLLCLLQTDWFIPSNSEQDRPWRGTKEHQAAPLKDVITGDDETYGNWRWRVTVAHNSIKERRYEQVLSSVPDIPLLHTASFIDGKTGGTGTLSQPPNSESVILTNPAISASTTSLPPSFFSWFQHPSFQDIPPKSQLQLSINYTCLLINMVKIEENVIYMGFGYITIHTQS